MAKPDDVEKLIHDLEFENQAYVKEIERENQQIEALGKQINALQQDTEKRQEITPQLDDDIKRYHRQYTQNRDSVDSLKRTLEVLAEHEEALSKKLDIAREKAETEKLEQKCTVEHYRSMWSDYQNTYQNFKMAKRLQEEQTKENNAMQEHAQIQTNLNKSGNNLIALQKELEKSKNLMNLNTFIVSIAQLKLETSNEECQLKRINEQYSIISRKIEERKEEMKRKEEEELRKTEERKREEEERRREIIAREEDRIRQEQIDIRKAEDMRRKQEDNLLRQVQNREMMKKVFDTSESAQTIGEKNTLPRPNLVIPNSSPIVAAPSQQPHISQAALFKYNTPDSASKSLIPKLQVPSLQVSPKQASPNKLKQHSQGRPEVYNSLAKQMKQVSLQQNKVNKSHYVQHKVAQRSPKAVPDAMNKSQIPTRTVPYQVPTYKRPTMPSFSSNVLSDITPLQGGMQLQKTNDAKTQKQFQSPAQALSRPTANTSPDKPFKVPASVQSKVSPTREVPKTPARVVSSVSEVVTPGRSPKEYNSAPNTPGSLNNSPFNLNNMESFTKSPGTSAEDCDFFSKHMFGDGDNTHKGDAPNDENSSPFMQGFFGGGDADMRDTGKDDDVGFNLGGCSNNGGGGMMFSMFGDNGGDGDDSNQNSSDFSFNFGSGAASPQGTNETFKLF